MHTLSFTNPDYCDNDERSPASFSRAETGVFFPHQSIAPRIGPQSESHADPTDHPNIARVLDAGTTDQGRPLLVLESIRGNRVTDYCESRAFPILDHSDMFVLVCRAILWGGIRT